MRRAAAELAYRAGRIESLDLRPGWTLRCHPASADEFRLFRDHEDYRAELEAFVSTCTAGMVLLDVGANFGFFTLAALHYGGPSTRAIAVDPSPGAHRVLEVNLSLMGTLDRVARFRLALASWDGEIEVLDAGLAAEHQMHRGEIGRPDTKRVAASRMTSLLARAEWTPSHVKVDVEGFELDVLQGGESFIRKCRPIIMLELHTRLLRSLDADPMAVLALLEQWGYRFEWRGRPIVPGQAAALDIARLMCFPVPS
jgi:FkbM family methyltransferase